MRRYSQNQLKTILLQTDTDVLIEFIGEMLPVYETSVRMASSVTPLQKQCHQEKVICKMETLFVLLNRGNPL
jgi:hypothetical protein